MSRRRAHHADVGEAAASGDDTTAIQAALDGGFAVVRGLPGQDYNVATLTVPAGVTLDMTGCTVTQMDAIPAVLCTLPGDGAAIIGGTWDGNTAGQTTANAGLLVTGDDCAIVNARVENTRGTGIYLAGANRPRVTGCTVVDTGYIGIFAETSGSSITGVLIRDCHVDRSALSAATIAEGGIKVHGQSAVIVAEHTRIESCTVALPTSPVDGSAVAIETTYCPRSAVLGCSTLGGAIGISLAASDFSVVSGNNTRGASTYGVENAGSDRGRIDLPAQQRHGRGDALRQGIWHREHGLGRQVAPGISAVTGPRPGPGDGTLGPWLPGPRASG